MTFFSKIQRTIPALKPLLPKAPVQHFHTSSTRVNPLRNMPAAAIPVQQRLALVNLRPYSSDHRNDTEDPFDDKKELALYATVAFSAGFLHTVIVRNSVQAKEIEPVTDSKGTETLNDNQRFLISISDQICEEISEAFDLSIAKVKKYLSRQCFNSESEFADHVYMMFKVRLEVHNFGREEQGLIPISLNLAFKQYCAARFWIIENIKNPKGTSLSLSGRNLYALPPELMNCKHVTELDISNNRLISIPTNIEQLQNLTILKAGLNEIHRFPQGVVSLPNLEHLDLSHNPIESCPLQILKLKKLKTLDLNNTNILAIPDQIKRSGVKIFFDKKPPTA